MVKLLVFSLRVEVLSKVTLYHLSYLSWRLKFSHEGSIHSFRMVPLMASVCRMEISHLAFSDDIIIFPTGEKRGIRNLMNFLSEYENSSGQRVNRQKTSFYVSPKARPVRISTIQVATALFRRDFPLTYLGCTLLFGRKRINYLQPLLDKVTARIAGWQHKVLSMGGRLILIKDVLTSIPMYLLATLIPPTFLLQELENDSNPGNKERVFFQKNVIESRKHCYQLVWLERSKHHSVIVFPFPYLYFSFRTLTLYFIYIIYA